MLFESALNNRIVTLSREIVLDRPLDQPIEQIDAKVEIEWKLATEADVEALSEEKIQYYDYRKHFAKKLLREGSIGLIGYVGEEAVNVGWITFDRIDNPPFSVPLGPGWAYFHHVRTAPAWRGNGIHPASICKQLEIAKANGAKRALILVDTSNAVSLNNYRKAGFTDQTRIWALEIGGHKVMQGISGLTRMLAQ